MNISSLESIERQLESLAGKPEAWREAADLLDLAAEQKLWMERYPNVTRWIEQAARLLGRPANHIHSMMATRRFEKDRLPTLSAAVSETGSAASLPEIGFSLLDTIRKIGDLDRDVAAAAVRRVAQGEALSVREARSLLNDAVEVHANPLNRVVSNPPWGGRSEFLGKRDFTSEDEAQYEGDRIALFLKSAEKVLRPGGVAALFLPGERGAAWRIRRRGDRKRVAHAEQCIRGALPRLTGYDGDLDVVQRFKSRWARADVVAAGIDGATVAFADAYDVCRDGLASDELDRMLLESSLACSYFRRYWFVVAETGGGRGSTVAAISAAVKELGLRSVGVATCGEKTLELTVVRHPDGPSVPDRQEDGRVLVFQALRRKRR